jgi:aspartyl-tRNA(Asn)/glutamyl-tRNA(Gln) amidotransferase subunit C
MSLTVDELRKVAHLARLSLSEADIGPSQKKISNILELVDQINSVNTDHVEPMAHPIPGMIQRLRPDEVTTLNEREAYQSIAPLTEAGLYLVPQVIDHE